MKWPSMTLVPQLDRSPRWVAFAQTLSGKMTLVAAFGALLYLHSVYLWWLFAVYLLAFSLWPHQRWKILLAATWSYLFIAPTNLKWSNFNVLFRQSGLNWQINSTLEGLPLIALTMVLAVACLKLVHSKTFSRYLKRPVMVLICLNLGLMIVASYAPFSATARALLWACLAVFGQYFWFICYSLKESRAPKPLPLPLQFGHYYPFWSPGVLPYPKGTGYLQKIEAKTDEAFAVCRLKGVKLLLWALWLKLFAVIINVTLYGYADFFYGRLQFKRELETIQLFFDGNHLFNLLTLPVSGFLPQYEMAFNLAAGGAALPWHTNWAVLICNFLYSLLHMAFSTHIIIAIIRMCGFNALRNTYKPLSSKTIAEFWNRFYFYFKELLVEFFFYPVFFRYFKNRPLLRTYAATMAAAFFGNFLFHFMSDTWISIELGFFEALAAYEVYFVYTFILGNGIFLSQWHQQRVGHRQPKIWSKYIAPVRVLGFYCLLSIFVNYRGETLVDNLAFLYSLWPF